MSAHRFDGEAPSLRWVKWTDHIRIKFPGWVRAQNDYELIRNLFGLKTEPAGFVLKGRTGTGKTEAAKAYKARFPDHREGRNWKVKVCHAIVPGTPTRLGVVRCLLHGLRDLAYESGSRTDELTERLLKKLDDCGTELIILDEFQHVTSNANKNVPPEVANWLKVFFYRCRIPFVLVGDMGCDRILWQRGNEQLLERFAAPKIMTTFDWKLAEPISGAQRREFQEAGLSVVSSLSDPDIDGRTFMGFLDRFDDEQPFPKFGLAKDEMAWKMLLATKGNVRRINKIVMGAVHHAVVFGNGRRELTMEDFASAFDYWIARRDPPSEMDLEAPCWINPFR